MRPVLRTVLLCVSIAALLAIVAQAQETWKPAIRFTQYLGTATYLPGLGECGYAQFETGPDGVREGIYDLKTLSDTSRVVCNWPGGGVPYPIRSPFDFLGNGLTDVYVYGLDLYFDICSPVQRVLPQAPAGQYIAFAGGAADIDDNGVREYLCDVRCRKLITLSSGREALKTQEILSRHTFVDERNGGPTTEQPTIMHLGTLGGKPRFLVVTNYASVGPDKLRFVLETLTPEQVQSDSATLTLATITVTDSPLTEFKEERLFIFPNVWYLGGLGGKTWAITADTMVLVDMDRSMGADYSYSENYGQKRNGDVNNYSTVDGTRVELIRAEFASLRYVKLHADGARLWAEELGRIITMLSDGVTKFHPSETAIVGDIDGDGLEDVILSGSTAKGKETQLYLTTGRFLSSVQENGSQTMVLTHNAEGWLIPATLCEAPNARRVAIYDVQGSLVVMTDVVPTTSGMLVRNVALPQGLHFAVIGSCVFRLQ